MEGLAATVGKSVGATAEMCATAGISAAAIAELGVTMGTAMVAGLCAVAEGGGGR